jgi:hypothetical protein
MNKTVQLPILEKTDICEFNIFTEKSIYLRESVSLRGLTLVGHILPKIIVEELIEWDQKNK